MQYLSFLIPTWMILECFKAVGVGRDFVFGGGKEAEGLDVGNETTWGKFSNKNWGIDI